MPAQPLLYAFAVTSLALAVAPGPGVFFIVTRTLAHGRRAGLASVAGVALGNLANACAAALGLTALFTISSLAFTLVKYAGALYLIFLGVRTLRSTTTAQAVGQTAAPGHIFRDGFFVAALNPKTAVFFAAFLPQFLGAMTPTLGATITLSTLFVAIAAITDSAYALTAGTFAPALERCKSMRALGRYASASALIGLGLFTALAGSRSAK